MGEKEASVSTTISQNKPKPLLGFVLLRATIGMTTKDLRLLPTPQVKQCNRSESKIQWQNSNYRAKIGAIHNFDQSSRCCRRLVAKEKARNVTQEAVQLHGRKDGISCRTGLGSKLETVDHEHHGRQQVL